MQSESINNATILEAPGPSVTESCKWILAIDSFPLHRLRLRVNLILEQLLPSNTRRFQFLSYLVSMEDDAGELTAQLFLTLLAR